MPKGSEEVRRGCREEHAQDDIDQALLGQEPATSPDPQIPAETATFVAKHPPLAHSLGAAFAAAGFAAGGISCGNPPLKMSSSGAQAAEIPAQVEGAYHAQFTVHGASNYDVVVLDSQEKGMKGLAEMPQLCGPDGADVAFALSMGPHLQEFFLQIGGRRVVVRPPQDGNAVRLYGIRPTSTTPELEDFGEETPIALGKDVKLGLVAVDFLHNGKMEKVARACFTADAAGIYEVVAREGMFLFQRGQVTRGQAQCSIGLRTGERVAIYPIAKKGPVSVRVECFALEDGGR